jgi:hypothetical protein|tara:strand:+ start:1928 stop:2062 length:135 start_codon:yes stop_codon:yes gene_type:complete
MTNFIIIAGVALSFISSFLVILLMQKGKLLILEANKKRESKNGR